VPFAGRANPTAEQTEALRRRPAFSLLEIPTGYAGSGLAQALRKGLYSEARELWGAEGRHERRLWRWSRHILLDGRRRSGGLSLNFGPRNSLALSESRN